MNSDQTSKKIKKYRYFPYPLINKSLLEYLSKKTIQEEKDIKVRFCDILGIDEFKEELVEIVEQLKNGEKYKKAGASLPKGILLVGPPGTGKTLLAKALAGNPSCSAAVGAEGFVDNADSKYMNFLRGARASLCTCSRPHEERRRLPGIGLLMKVWFACRRTSRNQQFTAFWFMG